MLSTQIYVDTLENGTGCNCRDERSEFLVLLRRALINPSAYLPSDERATMVDSRFSSAPKGLTTLLAPEDVSELTNRI